MSPSLTVGPLSVEGGFVKVSGGSILQTVRHKIFLSYCIFARSEYTCLKHLAREAGEADPPFLGVGWQAASLHDEVPA